LGFTKILRKNECYEKKKKTIAQISDKQSTINNIIYLEIKKIIIFEIMLQNHKLDYFDFNILINISNFIYVDL